MKRNDIDALARLLDEGGAAETVAAPAESRALAALAAALESSAAPLTSRVGANAAGAPPRLFPAPETRPEFKNELRAMLIDAAREQAARPSILGRLRERVDGATSRWRYSSSVAAATGATALALSSGGVALASEQALPGDLLYGVKLTLEDARLTLERNPVARAEQRLAYASERLDEAEQVALAGDHSAAATALREAEEAARVAAGELIRASQESGDPRALKILGDWTRENRPRIEDMEPMLNGPARIAFGDVLTVLQRIDQRLAVLRDAVTCAPRAAESARSTGANATASPGEFDFSAIPSADEPFTACPTGTEIAPSGDTSTTTGPGAAAGRAGGAGKKATDTAREAAKDAKDAKGSKTRKGTDAAKEPVNAVAPVEEAVSDTVDGTGSQSPTSPKTGETDDGGVEDATGGAGKRVEDTVKDVDDKTSGNGGNGGGEDPLDDVIEEVTNPKPPTVRTESPVKPPTLPTTPPSGSPDLSTDDATGAVEDVEESLPGGGLP